MKFASRSQGAQECTTYIDNVHKHRCEIFSYRMYYIPLFIHTIVIQSESKLTLLLKGILEFIVASTIIRPKRHKKLITF